MLKKLVFGCAALGLAGNCFAVGSLSCGQARPNLRVCLSSGSYPGGSTGSLSLERNGQNIQVDNLQWGQIDGPGTFSDWGTAVIDGQPVEIKLVTYNTNPATAQLFYRAPGTAYWYLAPGT